MSETHLPRDHEGREIPLDTDVLYDEDGREFKVDRFTYSVTQLISDLKWGVVFDDCSVDYCCAFHLTPPDSWESFADSGMECTVRRYEYLLGAGVWRACCDEGVVRVDDMHLIRPDTFGALMNDIEAALACPSSKEPTHAYNVVSGICDACADMCGGTLCQSMALHNICNRIHSLTAGDGE